MKVKDFFSNNFVTSENNYYESLRTRYYRAKITEAKNAVYDLISSEKGKMVEENDTFSEILYETPLYSCTVILVSTGPVEIAIDFSVTTYNFLGLGKGKKVIEHLYQQLDSKLTFKGIALYKG